MYLEAGIALGRGLPLIVLAENADADLPGIGGLASDVWTVAGVTGDRHRTADGWAVEVVALSATPDGNDGVRLKVTYGFFVESSGIAAGGRTPQ